MTPFIKLTPLGWQNSPDPRWPAYRVLLRHHRCADNMRFTEADDAWYRMLTTVHGQPTILPGPDESSKIATFIMSHETEQKLTALGLRATPTILRGLAISAACDPVYPT